MIDTAPVKAQTDLFALVSSDTRLTKIAGTRGGEYAGPCPFCGGTDRFRVQPERSLWWCRGCSPSEHWQDAIAYKRQRDGLSFADACAALERHAAPSAPRREPIEKPREPQLAAWREAALSFVERCEEALWGVGGVHARTYLTERGLTAETVKRWRLGLNPQDGKVGGKWFARAGITIPWFNTSGELVGVKIRLRAPDEQGNKYKSLTGSRSDMLYGAETLAGHRYAALFEGEFDMLLAWQAAGDIFGCATLGSAGAKLHAGAIDPLLPIECILLVYDMDGAGNKSATGKLALSRRMVQVAVPIGKDVTEAWKYGIDLRAWLGKELQRIAPDPVLADIEEPREPSPFEGEGLPAYLGDLLTESLPQPAWLRPDAPPPDAPIGRCERGHPVWRLDDGSLMACVRCEELVEQREMEL